MSSNRTRGGRRGGGDGRGRGRGGRGRGFGRGGPAPRPLFDLDLSHGDNGPPFFDGPPHDGPPFFYGDDGGGDGGPPFFHGDGGGDGGPPFFHGHDGPRAYQGDGISPYFHGNGSDGPPYLYDYDEYWVGNCDSGYQGEDQVEFIRRDPYGPNPPPWRNDRKTTKVTKRSASFNKRGGVERGGDRILRNPHPYKPVKEKDATTPTASTTQKEAIPIKKEPIYYPKPAATSASLAPNTTTVAPPATVTKAVLISPITKDDSPSKIKTPLEQETQRFLSAISSASQLVEKSKTVQRAQHSAPAKQSSSAQPKPLLQMSITKPTSIPKIVTSPTKLNTTSSGITYSALPPPSTTTNKVELNKKKPNPVIVGDVTHLCVSSGVVSSEIYFNNSAVIGNIPSIGDKVVLEVEHVTGMPFKFIGRRVQIISTLDELLEQNEMLDNMEIMAKKVGKEILDSKISAQSSNPSVVEMQIPSESKPANVE